MTKYSHNQPNETGMFLDAAKNGFLNSTQFKPNTKPDGSFSGSEQVYGLLAILLMAGKLYGDAGDVLFS